MKFFFDARYIRTDFHDGISRYTHELAEAIYEQKPDTTFLISSEKQRAFLPQGAQTIIIHPTTSWKEAFTALILNKYRPDVVATPLQTMGSFGRKFKLILNQQDLTYYKHASPPPQFSWWVRMMWRLYHLGYAPGRMVLNAADIIATVSETSKKEIEAARLTKRPIIVVPNAARDLKGETHLVSHQEAIKPHDLIYMGSFIPYKNVETLINMMALLPDRTLHLLSRISDTRKAELLRLGANQTQVVFHGGVSDEEYAELLADNAIMVSASRSEGFNLNLIEALAFGVPAVVSELPVHREVAGEGALYARSDDIQDFAIKINSLDPLERREEIIQKAQTHIKKFSWAYSAEVLLSAAEKLVQK